MQTPLHLKNIVFQMLQVQKNDQKIRKRNLVGSFSLLQIDKSQVRSILYLGSKESWYFNQDRFFEWILIFWFYTG